jgi:hypothetical protein
MTKNRKNIFFLWILILCLIGVNHKAKAKEPLEKGNFFWHWHRKTCLTEENVKKILQFNIKGIFFHMGEFDYYRDKPRFKSFEFQADTFKKLKDLNSIQVHLVYTFSGTPKKAFVKYFNDNTEEAIEFVLEEIESNLNVFQGKGLKISGIQLDMETNLQLRNYTQLINTVARRFGRDYLISITPRVYWYKKKGFRELIKNVDFIVPMIYDYSIVKRAKSLMKVTDIKWIKNVLKKYKRLKKPFYAGLPTYSYCKIYNKKGRRVESWAILSVKEVSENKDFRLIKTKKGKGQNTYVFKAVCNTKLSGYTFSPGWIVKFNIITLELVKKYMNLVDTMNAHNLLGVAFFRYGYFKENLVLNEIEIAQALGYNEVKGCIPKGEVVINREDYKQLAIGEEVKINLLLINAGDQDSYVGRGANQLRFEVENGEIIKYDEGKFDSIKREKEKLIFREKHLSVNEAVYSGLIKIEVKAIPLILKISAKSLQLNKKAWCQSEKEVIKLFPLEEKIKFFIKREVKKKQTIDEEIRKRSQAEKQDETNPEKEKEINNQTETQKKDEDETNLETNSGIEREGKEQNQSQGGTKKEEDKKKVVP